MEPVEVAKAKPDRVTAEARPGKVMAVVETLLPLLPLRRRSSRPWAMMIYRFRAGNS